MTDFIFPINKRTVCSQFAVVSDLFALRCGLLMPKSCFVVFD